MNGPLVFDDIDWPSSKKTLPKTVACNLLILGANSWRTKLDKSGGLEKVGQQRTVPDRAAALGSQELAARKPCYSLEFFLVWPPEEKGLYGVVGGGRDTGVQHSLAGFRITSLRFADC